MASDQNPVANLSWVKLGYQNEQETKQDKTKNKQKFLLGFWMEYTESIDQFEESQHTSYVETLVYKYVLSLHLEIFISPQIFIFLFVKVLHVFC